jgi:hypothetical protein
LTGLRSMSEVAQWAPAATPEVLFDVYALK